MKTLSVVLAFMGTLALAVPSYPAGDPQGSELVGAHYSQGEEKARRGEWKEAAALFQKAVEADDQHYQAFNMLGYSLRMMGRAQDAIAAYDKALSIKPAYAPALEYRGVAHVMAGNRAAALADFQNLKNMGSPLAEDLREKIKAMPTN